MFVRSMSDNLSLLLNWKQNNFHCQRQKRMSINCRVSVRILRACNPFQKSIIYWMASSSSTSVNKDDLSFQFAKFKSLKWNVRLKLWSWYKHKVFYFFPLWRYKRSKFVLQSSASADTTLSFSFFWRVPNTWIECRCGYLNCAVIEGRSDRNTTVFSNPGIQWHLKTQVKICVLENWKLFTQISTQIMVFRPMQELHSQSCSEWELERSKQMSSIWSTWLSQFGAPPVHSLACRVEWIIS